MDDDACTCVNCEWERQIVADFEIGDPPEEDLEFVPAEHVHNADCYGCG